MDQKNLCFLTTVETISANFKSFWQLGLLVTNNLANKFVMVDSMWAA